MPNEDEQAAEAGRPRGRRETMSYQPIYLGMQVRLAPAEASTIHRYISALEP